MRLPELLAEPISVGSAAGEFTGADDKPDQDPTATEKPRRSRSQGSCRRVAPSTDAAAGADAGGAAEKALPNGDVYRGDFAGSLPHGHGKYLWTDGCMYEGDWRRGKAAGKGKFSWPSGATFEGEFRSGRMEGMGTFTSPDGGAYHGSWVADRKHGFGRKCYANGDRYKGFWRRNLQEGQGRYVWRNGNEYVGEWKSGAVSGRGVLIWANGNRYDGHWDGGVPDGSGVFTWPDGSCYVGTWGKDPRSLNGVFYPAVAKPRPVSAAPASSSPKRAPALGRTSSASAQKGFPRICIWESDGEAGDITCYIIDALEASLMCRADTHFFNRAMDASPSAQQNPSPCCFAMAGEAKKSGQTLFKGHKNYNLMLSLQLGVSYSVGNPDMTKMKPLQSADFDAKEKFWTRFPPEGSRTTPPHQSPDFRWKDYNPEVFRHLRKLFSVDTAEYMLAICGNVALRELSSPGKSGSFFYLTQDDRFMIKTVLIRMLPSYYQHVCQYQTSLVTKFYGVHCVKPIGCPKIRFLVMGNLFCSAHRIHRRFDLKGSSYGRTTDTAHGEMDETTTFKDLDLDFIFRLQKPLFQEFMGQIERDCEFLEAEGIMDYSLLVGVHFCDAVSPSRMCLSPGVASQKSSSKGDSFQILLDTSDSWLPDSIESDIRGDGKPSVQLGSNMRARAEHASCRSVQVHDVILYLGIIDILQDYDIIKKLEHAYKSLQVDPASISAVDPKLYSARLRDFVGRIFMEEEGAGD